MEARIPVTTVARTLLDLAEVLDEDGLRRAFEEADRLKLLRMPELEWVCARASKRQGLVALRRLVAASTAPVTTRSPLEDTSAGFYREHLADLPAPLTNVSILDHEVDAYWPLTASSSRWTAGNSTATEQPSRATEPATPRCRRRATESSA